MKNQKGFVVPLIIIVVAILAVGGWLYYYANYNEPFEVFRANPNEISPLATTTPIIGGDKDEHGCLGPAGYSWCEVKNKCLRVWEEKCEGTPINSGPGDKDGKITNEDVILVLSPNGGESIPFSQVTMAGELYFNWTTLDKTGYVPTDKFKAYVVDVYGDVLRDDPVSPKYSTSLNPGNGVFRTYFSGDRNLKINTKYKIKICDYIKNQEYCDLSDNYFTIN